jgi:hypothetical protein
MTVTILSLNDASKDVTSSAQVSQKELNMKQKCSYEFDGGYSLQFLYYERTNSCKQESQLVASMDEETLSSEHCSDSTSDSENDVNDATLGADWRD